MLRATAATLLRAAGVSVEVVQELLGRASPVTTQRYDRDETVLDGHAAYRLTDLLTQQPVPGPGGSSADIAAESTATTDATVRSRRTRPPRHRDAQPLASRRRKPADSPRRKR
jgi:hypothetical protein